MAFIWTLLLVSIAQVGYCLTYTVTSTADSGGGTLRFGITQVNAGLYDTIDFNIPTSDGGYNPAKNTWSIAPATELPPITKPVTINGYSQPGSSVNTLTQGDNAVLTIILNGLNVTSDGYTVGNGLHFLAGSDASLVKGLVINRWGLNGILLDGTNGTINGIQIVGNFIGIDSTGTKPIPTRTGVGISGAVNAVTNTLVGTVNVADRNIFGGSFGYMIFDSYVIRGACICSCYNSGTTIVNNYIGTDPTGTVATGISQCGIVFTVETDSTIGGATAATLNLISGQTIYGISLTSVVPIIPGALDTLGGCTDCLIQGNYLGTNISGTKALANDNAAIAIDSYATGNSVSGNLISGNGVGIRLGQFDMPGSLSNTVTGNYIGTDATGSYALGNTNFGIIVNDSKNTIGGTTPAEANLISGNGKGGIHVYGTVGVVVSNNLIGTDVTGKLPIPNRGDGVELGAYGPPSCAAVNSTIGL
jgi:hypothetical protein